MEKVPQIVIIVLFSINLLIAANRHGKMRPVKMENFWVDLTAVTIVIAVLIWGGFFNNLFS